MIDLTKLTTEQQNPKTKAIDEASALEIVKLINAEDHTVPKAVKKILPDISRAIIVIANRLSHGGRLFYIGSGTSGRLGILDASECPPTYNTPRNWYRALSPVVRLLSFVRRKARKIPNLPARKTCKTKN